MTTSDNIAAIEKAMEGVTPGPWVYYADLPSTEPNWHVITTANKLRVLANIHIEPGNRMDEANAAYIAVCSPDRISTLLAEARKAEAMKREIAELRDVMRGCHAALKMMIDPGDISGSTVSTAFAAATSAEFRARTLLNGGSDAQG